MHAYVQFHLDSLSDWVTNDFSNLAKSSPSEADLQKSFFEGRRHYKHIEFAIEYFFPTSAGNLNGPALPEIEPEEHIVIEPSGFQVIEEILFPFDSTRRLDLQTEIAKLRSISNRLRQLWEGHQFRTEHIFDALRTEVNRINSLHLAGFDAPVSLTGLNDIRYSLQSIKDVCSFFKQDSTAHHVKSIQSAADGAIALLSNADFDSFDRLIFIREYMNPLSRALLKYQQALAIPDVRALSAINPQAPTIFDRNAFNTNFFAPDQTAFSSPSRIALGEKIFYDRVLSANKKISCASCHDPKRGFTDGLPKSRALAGNGFLPRNTPTLLNAGLQKMQFYDMRAGFLEDQVRNVIENKDEIHGSLEQAVADLRKDSCYTTLIAEAFPGAEFAERQLQIALASYVRSLVSLNSRFDKYMRGDDKEMNPSEKRGFNLFMGKAKCGTCHFMPLFNGTVPPAFAQTEGEVIGVPSTASGKIIDADTGRYGIYQIPQFRFAFKTPSVRHLELTAPYMHNGVFKTLEEVVDFYNEGGGNGLGMNLEYQTLPEDKLNLSSEEKAAIVAFLKALN